MKLHQLRDVIAVADQGSLRAAARHLNIAQSAISKSVSALEKELGVPLFERQKRATVLTAMGTLFVQRARTASSELARAQDEISQHRGEGAGRVTVGLSTVPHIALLPSAVDTFTRRFPDVSLTVVEALGFHTVEAQMRDGAIDAYVGIAPASKLSNEYVVEPLFRNQRCVIGRKGHPLAGAQSLEDLTDARWVVSSAQHAKSSFTTLFAKHRFKAPSRVIYAESVLSQLIFLQNCDALMIAPVQALEFGPYAGRLVQIPVREAMEAPMVVMVRRAALPLTPAAEFFCDLMRRESVPMQALSPS